MNTSPKQRTASDPRVLFLRGFLKRPREVGSIIPSSRFLERRLVRMADLASARTVVELGPGTGGTTRALLRAMPADSRLLVIEINQRFASLIRATIDDPRLIVHVGDASDLAAIVSEHSLPAPDLVCSGIPFSTLPRETGLAIVRAIEVALRPGGRFVAYQVRDAVETLGKQVFGPARVETERLNVPPMRIFRWNKAEG